MKWFGDVRYKVAIFSLVFLMIFFKVFFGLVNSRLNPIQSYQYHVGSFLGEYERPSKQSIGYKIELDNGRSVSIYRDKQQERFKIGSKFCFRVGIRNRNVYRPITEVALSDCGK